MPDSAVPATPRPGAGADGSAPTYYVYMVSCEGGSVYTGITTDVARRMAEHLSRSTLAARYTRTHHVLGIVGLWRCVGRSAASALEYRIHHLSRARKDVLLAQPERVGELAGDGFEVVPREEREHLWREAVARAGR